MHPASSMAPPLFARKTVRDSAANCNFVQIPSELPKNPEISLKITKFLLSFSCSQSLRNLGLRPLIVCFWHGFWPLAFASLPKRNFVNMQVNRATST